jgi:hypothetical protein
LRFEDDHAAKEFIGLLAEAVIVANIDEAISWRTGATSGEKREPGIARSASVRVVAGRCLRKDRQNHLGRFRAE